MTSQRSVLVLGAGELGLAMLEALATHPSKGSDKVTVLLRVSTTEIVEPAKRKMLSRLQSLNVDIITGDLQADSTESFATKFSKFHTIIGCSGMEGGGKLQKKITNAVLSAEPAVARYIPWQFGVDYDLVGHGEGVAQQLFKDQVEIRDTLRAQSRTSWIIVSTGIFMSFLFNPLFGVCQIDDGKVNALGSWGNELTATSVEDIGRATAEIVWAAEEISNQVVFVAGETIIFGRLADIIEKATGRGMSRELWTLDSLRGQLREDPQSTILKYRIVWAEGKVVAWDKGKTFNALRGIETETIEHWAMKHLTP